MVRKSNVNKEKIRDLYSRSPEMKVSMMSTILGMKKSYINKYILQIKAEQQSIAKHGTEYEVVIPHSPRAESLRAQVYKLIDEGVKPIRIALKLNLKPKSVSNWLYNRPNKKQPGNVTFTKMEMDSRYKVEIKTNEPPAITLTYDDIISAIPNTKVLGELILEGILSKLQKAETKASLAKEENTRVSSLLKKEQEHRLITMNTAKEDSYSWEKQKAY